MDDRNKSSLTSLLKDKGFTHKKSKATGLKIGARDIIKDGIVVFSGDYKEVKEWLSSYEITNDDAERWKRAYSKTYIDICPTCYYFDSKDKICDMCDAGGIAPIQNHGKKPTEVELCSIYAKDKR